MLELAWAALVRDFALSILNPHPPGSPRNHNPLNLTLSLYDVFKLKVCNCNCSEVFGAHWDSSFLHGRPFSLLYPYYECVLFCSENNGFPKKGKWPNCSAMIDLHQAIQIRSFHFKDLKSFLNCCAKEIRFICISCSSAF